MAAGVGLFKWGNFIAVLAGFVVAHMISNLSNDYFGFTRGHDTPESPRMRYTVHPFSSGILDSRTLLRGLALLGVIGLAITAYFILERGWMAAAFAVAGVSLLFLYDAAPTPLKSIGLGEFAVLLVWGPLMVGGGFAMITGQLSANAMLASLPYGLGVMTILNGKHIDQMAFDSRRGIRTLPVLIGEPAARALNIAAIVAIYAIIAILIGLGRLTPFAAVDRPRRSSRCPRHKNHEPTASGNAAGRLCRLAALVSPRLSSAQPRIRLGLYRRISGRRNLAWSSVAASELNPFSPLEDKKLARRLRVETRPFALSPRRRQARAACLSNTRVTNGHHIIPQERLLTLDFFEQRFERVAGVEHADWPEVSDPGWGRSSASAPSSSSTHHATGRQGGRTRPSGSLWSMLLFPVRFLDKG